MKKSAKTKSVTNTTMANVFVTSQRSRPVQRVEPTASHDLSDSQRTTLSFESLEKTQTYGHYGNSLPTVSPLRRRPSLVVRKSTMMNEGIRRKTAKLTTRNDEIGEKGGTLFYFFSLRNCAFKVLKTANLKKIKPGLLRFLGEF